MNFFYVFLAAALGAGVIICLATRGKRVHFGFCFACTAITALLLPFLLGRITFSDAAIVSPQPNNNIIDVVRALTIIPWWDNRMKNGNRFVSLGDLDAEVKVGPLYPVLGKPDVPWSVIVLAPADEQTRIRYIHKFGHAPLAISGPEKDPVVADYVRHYMADFRDRKADYFAILAYPRDDVQKALKSGLQAYLGEEFCIEYADQLRDAGLICKRVTLNDYSSK